MRTATFNLSDQYKGDSFERINFEFYATKDDTGNEIDMTGYIPKMEMRKDSAAGKLIKTLTIGDGLEWTDQTLGTMYVNPFLWTFETGDFVYDLQMTHPDSTVLTYVRGSFKVIDDVTS